MEHRKLLESLERSNAKEWDEQSTVSMAPSTGTMNFERSNAREWDEQSSVSFAPNFAEEAPRDDDYSEPLLDFGDFPPLPTPRQQQRQPAAPRSGNYNQASITNSAGRPGPPLTNAVLRPVASIGYQQNGSTNRGPTPTRSQAPFPASKTPTEPIIGLFIMNATSREAVKELFKDQKDKILKIEKRGQSNAVVHFKTVVERDAALQRLPQDVKSRTGADFSRPLVKIFREPAQSLGNRPLPSRQHPSNLPGSMLNNKGRSGPLLPQKALQQVPSVQYQENANRDGRGIGYRSDNSSSGSTDTVIPSNFRQSQDRSLSGTGLGKNRSRQHELNNTSGKPTKHLWADKAELVTSRRAKDLEIKAQKKAERQKYLRKPIDEERILGYGFYIWPKEDGSVFEVFGTKLELLDPIKIDHEVYIECVQVNGTQDVLKIDSESANPEKHVAGAIKSIRSAIGHARARAGLASPKYFIVPPTASAMRAFIGPREVNIKTEIINKVERTQKKCIGTKLIGEKLSGTERGNWRKQQLQLRKRYIEDFKGLLSDRLRELASLKEWMRMRVHFGHLVLTNFKPEFTTCQMSLDQFTNMMGLSRTRGEIERMIPATVARYLGKKIVEWPERFRPASGRSPSLEEVNFTHTEIIYVTTRQGTKLRVEAEIDVRYDEDYSIEYQLGAYDVFRDDHSNKRVELSIIDPERQVDCSLQLITDSRVEIPQTSKEYQMLIEGSISSKTRNRHDTLGLPFPEVRPQYTPELEITKVVVRSVIQYALNASGYVIEIAIYRTWYGPNTRWEPEVAASVSFFHPQWDLDMLSIENTTNERNWDSRLNNFFCNGAEPEGNGFENFLDEVQTVQGFLCDAANEVERIEASRQAAENGENGSVQEAEHTPAPSLLDS